MAQTSGQSPTVIDILEKQLVKGSSWSGATLNSVAGLIYLLRNHNGVCFPLDVYQKETCRYKRAPDIEWICLDTDGAPLTKEVSEESLSSKCRRVLAISEEFVDRFKECMNKSDVRFIIGMIHIRHYYPIISGHSNAFIYDKLDNSIEIFEPHGSRKATRFDSPEYEQRLESFFHDLGVDKFYADFCPAVSFQSRQVQEKLEESEVESDPFGFCQAWAIWWIDYRLSNANNTLSRQELANAALESLERRPNYFTTFIRNYAAFIISYRGTLLEEVFNDMNMCKEGQEYIDDLITYDIGVNKLMRKINIAKEKKDETTVNSLNEQIKLLKRPKENLLFSYLMEVLQQEIDRLR